MSKTKKKMMADEKIARATSITVGFVALFAAIVSYLHIRSLALDHGYDVFTAYLAPFGVDGLIVGASLMLLIAYRAKSESACSEVCSVARHRWYPGR